MSKLSHVIWRGLYLGAGGWGTPSQTVFTQGPQLPSPHPYSPHCRTWAASLWWFRDPLSLALPGAQGPSHTSQGPQEWRGAAVANSQHVMTTHTVFTPLLSSLCIQGGPSPSMEALFQASSPPSLSISQRKPTTMA